MADDIVVNVDFKGNASQFLAELSRAVNNAKTQLQEMGQSTSKLSRLETQLARMSGETKNLAAATTSANQTAKGWSQTMSTVWAKQFTEGEKAQKSLADGISKNFDSADKAYARASATLSKFETDQARNANVSSRKSGFEDWDRQFKSLSAAADVNVAKMRAAQKAIDDYQASLSNTRYVLYDVAGTLTTIGALAIVPFAAVSATAINMQKSFAQVERTSGVTGTALLQLKADFDSLYGSIPITYDSLAEIATLAGQLGVPASRIADFTEVTAKLAAVTDLSVDQAATAFGRLDALIPNVQGQYDRLGSAIAKVGVNSVATESQIVNISTQISAMGAFAGLTAQDIVGLSGALASIGAQPELSRGTVTRVFTLMSKAVAEGGEKLDEFARVSGVSSQQFASSWGTPQFTKVFLGFMNGIKTEGDSAVQTLNDLGITSVRDVPLLLRLANAADSAGVAGGLLAQTIGDSNEGWDQNIELQRQYAIIAETVAAKLEVLGNNFQLLLQAIGAPMLGAFGQFLDVLTQVVKWSTSFVQTDLGGNIARIVVVLSALAGVLAIAGGAMALMGASSIGVYQALQFITATSPKAAAALLGTSTAAGIANGTMKAGAASAVLFGRALAAFTVAGAILILPDLMGAVVKGIGEATGVMKDFDSKAKLLGSDANLSDMIAGFNGSRNAVLDFANSMTGTGQVFKEFDDQLKGLVDSKDFSGLTDELNKISSLSGIDPEKVLRMFGEVKTRAGEAGVELQVMNGQIVATGEVSATAAASSDLLASSQAAAEASAAQNAAALGVEQEALDAMIQALADGSGAFFDFAGNVKEAYAEGGGGIDAFIQKLNDQLTAQSTWADNIQVLTARGASSFAEELKKMGPEGAQLAADAVNLTAEQLAELEKKTAEAARLSSAAWATEMEAMQPLLNTAYAKAGDDGLKAMRDAVLSGNPQAVLDVINDLNSRFGGNPIKIPSNLEGPNNVFDVIREAQRIAANNPILIQSRIITGNTVQNGSYAPPPKFASGGRISGPGSGTSDSILARISNNEYIVREAAAKAIGYGRLDYMNRYGKLPGFANGGSPSRSSAPAGPSGMVVVELSARDRALLAAAGNVRLSIDGKDIANASNSANFTYAKTGKN